MLPCYLVRLISASSQGRSQDFILGGGTKAKGRRRENRSAEGTERVGKGPVADLSTCPPHDEVAAR